MAQAPLSSKSVHVESHTRLNSTQWAEWQAFLAAAGHQHPRQDPRFGAVEQADGRAVIYVTGRDSSGALRAVGLFSLKRSPFLPGVYFYASCLSGPVCDNAEVLVEFLEGVRQLPAFARVGRLRATPFWTDDDADRLAQVFTSQGWVVDEAEPIRQTGWVDLTPSPEGILAAFSKSARRELRRAERQGIAIRPLTEVAEASEFLASLNRLRTGRGLSAIPAAGFLTGFQSVHKEGDTGIILGAFHEGRFLSGLQLYRSKSVAHGRHFTLEPTLLHALSNLRISPLIWYEAMLWARQKGCATLDVEGWRPNMQETDYGYGIHKYKGEFAPVPVRRIAERGKMANWLVDTVTNAGRSLRKPARQILRRLRGKKTV